MTLVMRISDVSHITSDDSDIMQPSVIYGPGKVSVAEIPRSESQMTGQDNDGTRSFTTTNTPISMSRSASRMSNLVPRSASSSAISLKDLNELVKGKTTDLRQYQESNEDMIELEGNIRGNRRESLSSSAYKNHLGLTHRDHTTHDNLLTPTLSSKTNPEQHLQDNIEPHIPRQQQHQRTHYNAANDFLSIFDDDSDVKFVIVSCMWYASSACTNNLGKLILSRHPFPITLTYVQFLFAAGFTAGWWRLLGYTDWRPMTRGLIRSVAPLSLFSIVGHALSSVAIANLSVSFAHTIKGLGPLFTVLISRLFMGVRYHYKVYQALLPLTMGVVFACSGEISYNAVGILSALAGTIVVVTQNLSSKNLFRQHSLDKINMLYYVSLFAFILMTPFWMIMEFWWHEIVSINEEAVAEQVQMKPLRGLTWTLLGLYVLNGISYFAQNVFAIVLLYRVSPVTYSVASLFKRLVVIASSMVYFGDTWSSMKVFGITLSFIGMYLYKIVKHDHSTQHRKDHPILPMRHAKNAP